MDHALGQGGSAVLHESKEHMSKWYRIQDTIVARDERDGQRLQDRTAPSNGLENDDCARTCGNTHGQRQRDETRELGCVEKAL